MSHHGHAHHSPDSGVEPEVLAQFIRHRTVLGPIDRPSDTSVLKLHEEALFPITFSGQRNWPAHTDPGHTRLIAVRRLAHALEIDVPLYLKWEGTNPTGTHKDRIAAAHVQEVRAQDYREITAATCGNYGEALAFAAGRQKVPCTIFVPHLALDSPHHRVKICIERMESCGAEVVIVEGGYQEAVARSEAYAHDRNCGGRKRKAKNVYDANPSCGPGQKFELELDTYAQISHEMALYFQGRQEKISYVVVPVGNGITLLGVKRGFDQLKERGIIDQVPYLIGASQRNWATWKGNCSHLTRKIKAGDFDPQKNDNVALAGPALAWKPVRDLLRTGNLAVDISAHELAQAVRIAHDNFPLRMLEESAVTVAAINRVFPELKERKVSRLDRGAIILLITGQKD